AKEQYLVVADLAGRAERAAILLAAPLQPSEIEELFADRIEAREGVTFDAASGAVRARRARMLGRITLSEGPLDNPDSALVTAAFIAAIHADIARLPWSVDDQQFRARVASMRAREGDVWPDLSEAALRDGLEEWLAPALSGVTRFAQLADGRLS